MLCDSSTHEHHANWICRLALYSLYVRSKTIKSLLHYHVSRRMSTEDNATVCIWLSGDLSCIVWDSEAFWIKLTIEPLHKKTLWNGVATLYNISRICYLYGHSSLHLQLSYLFLMENAWFHERKSVFVTPHLAPIKRVLFHATTSAKISFIKQLSNKQKNTYIFFVYLVCCKIMFSIWIIKGVST